MRKRAKERRYRGRDQLLSDVHLLLDNCRIFNGDDHKYTMVAEQLLETCINKLGEVSELHPQEKKLIVSLSFNGRFI